MLILLTGAYILLACASVSWGIVAIVGYWELPKGFGLVALGALFGTTAAKFLGFW